MGQFTELRRNTFPGRRTLSLYFGESSGQATSLIDAMLDCSHNPSGTLGRDSQRLKNPHHPVLAVKFNLDFKLVLTSEEMRNCVRECDHLSCSHCVCNLDAGVYIRVYEKLAAKLVDKPCQNYQDSSGLTRCYQISENEHLSVAVFDLDLLS